MENNLNYILALNNMFRKLWEQHIFWTRSFIISNVLGLKDLEFVTQRLLRNPKDFADVLKIYYGNYNATRFQKLLEDHLLIAADLVNSAKQGDSSAVAEIEKKWYKNADDIAMLLASLNPYWDAQQWKSLMYEHLKMVKQEAVDTITSQFKHSVESFDAMEDNALRMADFLTSGIIKQFYS